MDTLEPQPPPAEPLPEAAAAQEPPPTVPPERELPEDLRVPWTWLDLVILLFVFVGTAILLSRVVGILVFLASGVAPAQFAKSANARTAFVTLHQALTSFTVMLYLYAMVRMRAGTPFWRTLGFRAFRVPAFPQWVTYSLFALGGMVLAVFIQIASIFVRTSAKLPMQEFFLTRESVLMMMASGLLVAPLVEEMVFRGYLYPVLARGIGVRAAVVGTGVLFGAIHLFQLWGGWGEIALLMVVGIVFTWVRARTGSVLTSYLLHMGYNGMLFLGHFLATNGLRNLPGGP